MENVEMNKTWLKIMEKKQPFTNIIRWVNSLFIIIFLYNREYKKRNYNANQDVPSNLYWREFAANCPHAKVVNPCRKGLAGKMTNKLSI